MHRPLLTHGLALSKLPPRPAAPATANEGVKDRIRGGFRYLFSAAMYGSGQAVQALIRASCLKPECAVPDLDIHLLEPCLLKPMAERIRIDEIHDVKQMYHLHEGAPQAV